MFSLKKRDIKNGDKTLDRHIEEKTHSVNVHQLDKP